MPNRGHVLLFCLALSGCATYQPQALKPALPQPVPLAQISVDARSLGFPELAGHRFDPSDGLDETEVATLAVVNNPTLKLARDDAAIAEAQAFSAGLLPDPQVALSGDLSNSGGVGATRAFSLGLSYDIAPLILRGANVGATRSEARKANLTLLWQEWQVISQARLLFVKLVHGRRIIAVLEQNRTLFADRVERTTEAQQRGLMTSDVVITNVAALQDVVKQLFDQQRQMGQNARDLNALLGLDAGVDVALQESTDGAFPDQVAVPAAIADLPRRRPDLLALAAGYDAQDQRYRGAVLAQFPALNVGLSRARDSSNIYSKSVGITLSLPFLNRNRGNIAIEKATRQKLFDEYQQRLQASRNEIEGILRQRELDLTQLAQVSAAVTRFEATLARSNLAFRSNNIDALAYASARAALLAKQVEQINLQQQLAEQRVALQTLLGVEARAQAPQDGRSK
jgi:outer membrane protein TolC